MVITEVCEDNISGEKRGLTWICFAFYVICVFSIQLVTLISYFLEIMRSV